MQAHKHTLQNGLRILTIPMPGMQSATVTVWVGVGSRYEEKSASGISHFLEHMVFKGGKKYPSAKIISETVDAMGAEFNAATSQEWTNFYIKTRVGKLEKACDVLSDMVLNPLLKDEDIKRERGVIIEELNMYEDNPIYKIGNLFEELMYEGNPLASDIGGSKETVSSISEEDFHSLRKQYYDPRNMVVTVAGGVSEEEVVKLVKKYFVDEKTESEFTKSFLPFSEIQTGPRVKLATKPIEQVHMIVGFLGNKLGSSHRFTEEVLATILGGGMSSRLFTEVREKRGLAYTVRSSVDNYLDTGAISTYAGVDPKKALEALKVILEEHGKLANGDLKVKESELVKAKEYVKGHFALALESTNAVGSFFGHDEILLGKYETPEEVLAGLEAVSVDDVVSLAREKFVRPKLNLAIVGSFKSSKEFEEVLQSHL